MSNDEGQTPEPHGTTSARQSSQERLAQLQKQQRRQGRKTPVIAGVVAALVLLGIAAGGWALINRDKEEALEGVPAANSIAPGLALGTVKTYTGLSNKHITTGFKYSQNPPVGGAHHPIWANCGVYDKEVKPGHAVHSLEHGAVWITYRASLPEDQIEALKQKVTRQQGYMLMSVDNTQGAPIALSAWGKQLFVRSASDPAVDKFISDFWKGPQTLEPGASCEGGYDPETDKLPPGA